LTLILRKVKEKQKNCQQNCKRTLKKWKRVVGQGDLTYEKKPLLPYLFSFPLVGEGQGEGATLPLPLPSREGT